MFYIKVFQRLGVLRRLGMLRRVQPNRPRSALSSGPTNPLDYPRCTSESEHIRVRRHRALVEPQLLRVHHHEPGLRRPVGTA